jgi:hypothetical protein
MRQNRKYKLGIYILVTTALTTLIFIGIKGVLGELLNNKKIINIGNDLYLDSQSGVDYTIYEPESFFAPAKLLSSKSIPCGKSKAFSVTYQLNSGGFIRVMQMPKGLTCTFNSLMKSKGVHSGPHSNYKISLDCSSALNIKCEVNNIQKLNSKIELSKNGQMNFDATSIVITGRGVSLENYQNFIKSLKPVLTLKNRNMRLVNLNPGEVNLRVKVGEYLVLKINDNYSYKADTTDREFAIYINGSQAPYFQPTAILIQKKGKATINLISNENKKVRYKINLST